MSEKLIQIIGYRKGLDKRTSKEFVWQKHFNDIKISSIVKLFENLEAVVAAIPESERYDIHYTNANCVEPTEDKSIPLRLFAYQEMIPIDLDGIDLSKKNEYIKIILETLKIEPNKTGMFCSGHGLHFVIALSKPIETGEELHRLQKYYKALCIKLNMEFYLNGLPGNADPIRLAEAATLRLPLTWNNKNPENPVQATVLQGIVQPQEFFLDKIIDIVEEEELVQSTRAVDTKAVLSGCDFLKKCLEYPQNVSEPEWYAMMGTLSFLPEVGVTLCHTYSEKHPDYSFEDTQTKAEQALGFGKPRTCESINQVFPGCAQCPNFRKVKTPLSIKSEDFISTETTGFHNIVLDNNGNPRGFKPNYSDLQKFFARNHTYVVNQTTQEVSIFNGKHWQEYTDVQIGGFATTHFRPMASNTLRSEFKGLLSSTNLVDQDFFGKSNVGYINFANGVLRLSDRTLLPHDPEFGFSYVLPYDFNPHAKAPEFEKLMRNVTLDDKDLSNLLLEYVGYAISGRRASFGSKALILTGGGSNGKSTFLNVIKMLIGRQCYSAVSLSDMSNPNARYSMVGKLFNICEEEEEDALRNGTAMFKSITTGGDILVKKLYADTMPMRIDAKLILSCNDLPSSRENTYAIYRRMLICPFRAKFEEKTADKGIEERIEKEMSGVYNLVLDAYDRLIKNNGVFSTASASQKALEEYKYMNSFYNQFADTCLCKSDNPDDFVATTELMSMYNTWAQANNVRLVPTPIKLAKELKAIGAIPHESVPVRLGHGVVKAYKGIKKQTTGLF